MLGMLFGGFDIFKKLISWIYSKLGITGMVIIILLVISGFEYHIIDNRDTTISNQNISLKTQNDSIIKVGEERNTLVKQLKDAQDKNLILDANNKELLDTVNKKPIAKTCDGAINEVKNSALQNAQLWNSGARK